MWSFNRARGPADARLMHCPLPLRRAAALACAVALLPALPAPAARAKKARRGAAVASPPSLVAPGRLRVRLNTAARCTASAGAASVVAEVGAGQEGLLEVPAGPVRLVCKSTGFDDAVARVVVGPDQGVPLRLVLPRAERETSPPPLDFTAAGTAQLPLGAHPQAGCRARVFLLSGADVHAPLPAASAETVLLPQLPQVTATARDPENGGQPNTLLRGLRAGLGNVAVYAVVYDGWLRASATGAHTFSATSDDPVALSLDGHPILRSDFSADPSAGPGLAAGQVATAQVVVSLTAGRWYQVEVAARQRWAPFPWGDDLPQEVLEAAASNRGATLRVSLEAPGGAKGPLTLSLPSAPTASR